MQPNTTLPKRQVKRYVATIAQSGTNPPTAIEYVNEIGHIIWTRTNTGQYRGTLIGSFPITDTWINIKTNGAFGTVLSAPQTDWIFIVTYNSSNVASDGILIRANLEIDVYNNY